jgi:hypothetical protein
VGPVLDPVCSPLGHNLGPFKALDVGFKCFVKIHPIGMSRDTLVVSQLAIGKKKECINTCFENARVRTP